MRGRRTPDPEAERQRAALHAEMVALGNHPSWEMLQAEVYRETEKIKRRVVSYAMAREGVDQRQIDFLRGCIKGMEWIASLPDGSERSLERYLAEHGVPNEGDA